ncbi:hypothetical protein AAG604_04175 [Citromicrobium bathyomarinum]
MMGSSQWDRFAAAEARERIIRGQVSAEHLCRVPHALLAGWDSIDDLSAIDPPNGGVWRTPHLAPAKFFAGRDEAPLGIFEDVGSPDELCARVWRLTRILPDATDERLGAESIDEECWEDEKSSSELDIFAARTDHPIAHRDQFIASIFGHTLRDHAEFLFDLLTREPELGALVLEKRFAEALVLDPDLLDRPWPASVRRRWQRQDFDFLPPFAHAVLVGEFQRLAQNVCSQASVSYFDTGKEVTLAATAKETGRYQKKSDRTGHASILYDPAIVKQMSLQPFQSLAILASGSVLRTGDSDAATADTQRATSALFKDLVNYGRPLIDFVSGHHPRSPSPDLAQGLMQHLDRAPDRKAKSGSVAHRKDFTATYWGMNWLTHAYVGLWQLAKFAAIYNQQWRPRGPTMSGRANRDVGRSVGLIQSIARIPYFWLETTNPTAFRSAGEKLARSSINNATTRAVRAFEGKAGMKASEDDKAAIKKEVEDRYEAFAIFDDQYTTIKERAVIAARKIAVKTPPAGMPGLTAQYRPYFWFHQGQDDIGFWIGREFASRRDLYGRSKTSRITRSAKELRQVILSDIERYRHRAPGIAAKTNQNLAMTFGAFAADPQHSWFRRKGIGKP